MNIQDWFPLGLTDLISLLSRDSQESSSAPQFKRIISLMLSLLYGPTLISVQLILFHLAVLNFTDTPFFTTNWRFVGTLHQARLLVVIFQTTFAHFVSLLHFSNSHNVLNLFIIVIFIIVICDIWCHYDKFLLLPSIFPSIRVYLMSHLFLSGGQSIEPCL